MLNTVNDITDTVILYVATHCICRPIFKTQQGPYMYALNTLKVESLSLKFYSEVVMQVAIMSLTCDTPIICPYYPLFP